MSLPPLEQNWLAIGTTNEDLAASLLRCIENNDKTTLQQLLENFKNASLSLPVTDERSMPVLHLAASNSQYKECLELLLKYNDSKLFDINEEWNHYSALHLACMHRCVENVVMLLQKGCDPYKVIPDTNQSVLLFAVGTGQSEIVEYLLNHHPDNINQNNCSASTPLHTALDFRRSDIAHKLLEKGANVLSVDYKGRLPLHFACNSMDFEIIRLLLEHDSTSVNHQTTEGITAIMLAAQSPEGLPAVRLLHEHGAKINIFDHEGRMVLHYSVGSGNIELLQYVLQHTETSCIEQCFLNIPNVIREKGVLHSLLICAIRLGSKECFEILLLSDKLSKCILQTPYIIGRLDFVRVYSPLTYTCLQVNSTMENTIPYVQLLLKHEVIMLDEFSKKLEIEWPKKAPELQHPFSNLFFEDGPFSRQQHFFYWLNENNITIDYCLQCYHDNTKPFASFTAYEIYYNPIIRIMTTVKMEALKLIMSHSAILEPDELLIQFNFEPCGRPLGPDRMYLKLYRMVSKEWKDNMNKYLISLKPIYYKLDHLCQRAGVNELSWYPYLSPGEEFSKCTLQQLCRTTIRHHIRGYTLEENLRDFRKNIQELPLPPVLKDYLLFKS